MADREFSIVIKARDQASPIFQKVADNAVGSAERIRKAGDIADVGGVKKVGKFLGDYGEATGLGNVREQGDEMRARAQERYAEKVREAVEAEKLGLVLDKARAGALQERANAAARLQAELDQINAAEREGLRNIGAARRRGEQVSPDAAVDVKDTAAEDRIAAERNYQEVVKRTAAVQNDAAATDKARIDAINARRAAAAEYGRTVKAIDAAERQAAKEALAGSRGIRAAAAAGGTLLALKLAGDLATAYDKANEKFEKGQIEGGREFAGEMAKSLPIIGSIAQGVEQMMLVVTGTASEMRKVNAEAAELDKKIAAQKAARSKASEVAGQYVGLSDTERQKIERASDAELKKIRDAREESRKQGTLGTDGAKLAAAEAAVIEKRRQDIAKIENDADLERIRHQQDVGDRLVAGERRVAEARASEVAAGLREQGREYEAEVAEINARHERELQEIRDRRQAIDREAGLSVAERSKLQDANDRERDAANAQRAADVRRAGEQSGKATAERIDSVRKEVLDARVAADPQLKREAELVGIKEKYLAIAKEIDAIEKGGNLTAEQRAELERRRTELLGAATVEVDRVRQGEASVVQGGRFAAAVDGRFNRESVAARSQVDVYRDSLAAQQKTAENTKSAADASVRAAKASEALLAFLRSLPAA